VKLEKEVSVSEKLSYPTYVEESVIHLGGKNVYNSMRK
jgi:hypothetical protein